MNYPEPSVYMNLGKVAYIVKQLTAYDTLPNSDQVHAFARRQGVMLTSYECITIANTMKVRRL